MLTHAARAAAKQLNATTWPRAARAKGSGQSNPILYTCLAAIPIDFVWLQSEGACGRRTEDVHPGKL